MVVLEGERHMSRTTFHRSGGRLLGLALGVWVCLAHPTLARAGEKEKESLPADLALVGDAAGFVRIEVGGAWNGKEADSLTKVSRSHPVVFTHEALEMEKAVGLRPEEIDRLVAIIPDLSKTSEAVLVVTTRKGF